VAGGGGRQRSYRDLVAWQKGMRLAKVVLRLTAGWAPDERYGMTAQIRRAAVSIPANIAEGQGRLGQRELLHHLSIAHGSLCELEALLELAQDEPFTNGSSPADLLPQTDEVGRIIRGLMKSIQ